MFHKIFKRRIVFTTKEDFNKGLLHPGVFSLELNPETRILYAGTRAGGVYWISLDG